MTTSGLWLILLDSPRPLQTSVFSSDKLPPSEEKAHNAYRALEEEPSKAAQI